MPPSTEKRSWRRYVFLWIKYAVFEELDCNDIARARAVCKAALAVIPHKSFSFSKLWVHTAHLELRARDLAAARLCFGRAIGQAPREKIFKAYIEMELQLGNLDRCRTLYQKFIEWAPENCGAWARYTRLLSVSFCWPVFVLTGAWLQVRRVGAAAGRDRARAAAVRGRG